MQIASHSSCVAFILYSFKTYFYAFCFCSVLLIPFIFKVDFHVHDEMIAEIPKDGNEKDRYDLMVRIMSTPPDWASDLPLRADGYITDYYKKD